MDWLAAALVALLVLLAAGSADQPPKWCNPPDWQPCSVGASDGVLR